MSEETRMKGYDKNGGIQFGEYELFILGNTTIDELKRLGFIPFKDYGNYGKLKPDALLVDRKNKKAIRVMAVIEGKNTNKFNSINKQLNAIYQCNTYCQLFDCQIGVATDMDEFIWINSLYKNEDGQHYIDTKGVQRSFQYILSEDGYNLSNVFPLDSRNQTEINKLLLLLKRINEEITENNSRLTISEKLNPSSLAKNVWQLIWLASGENPDSCLATFVEIFIFKYLSDLGVLKTNKSMVSVDYDSVLNSGEENCLVYYYDNVRGYIKEIFPAGQEDHTSIINGFILDKNVKEHNNVFYSILKSFNDYLTDENGNIRKLINIEPEFKSKLYEDFLKKSISQKNLGQYFTPRTIIKAIIMMSGIENLEEGAIVGDPACGVGGFLLESVITKRTNDYSFSQFDKEIKLISKLKYEGFDRDKKVIIMAKANMLLYLSEILKDNPTQTVAFAEKINETFKCENSSILGSLAIINENHYDLIMSNPPYVTKGITKWKEALSNSNESIKDFYKINGMGVESLFVEKMIRELKPGKKMFVIIPHGILDRVNDNGIRKFIKDSCIIDAFISLPRGTFYSTKKKTYIMVLTKKEKQIDQTTCVFSYIITEIGETLDVYREKQPDKNDLVEMIKEFKYFMIDKESYITQNQKCKKIAIDEFEPETNWCIERFWTFDEKVEIGIEKELNIVSIEDYDSMVQGIVRSMDAQIKKIGNINSKITKEAYNSVDIMMYELFEIRQGDAIYTDKAIKENKWHGNIPVISSNTVNGGVLAFIDEQYIKKQSHIISEECITWAIDGTYAGKLFLRNKSNNEKFVANNHAGILLPNSELVFYFYMWSRNMFKDFSKNKIKKYLDEAWTFLDDNDIKLIEKIKKNVLWNNIELFEIINNKDYIGNEKELLKIFDIITHKYNKRICINLRFILENMQPIIFQQARSFGNKKVGSKQIQNIKISIPVNNDGSFNCEIMTKIADEQEKLQKIRESLDGLYKQISDTQVVFE